MPMTYRGTSGPGSGYSLQGGYGSTEIDQQNLANTGALEQIRLKQKGDSDLLGQQEQMKQARLKSLLPMFSQGMAGGGFGGAPGGMAAPKPEITVGGIYSPEALQAQINQTRAANDQGAATQIQQNQNQMAGRGMSTSSPLAMALGNQINAANMANNAGGESQLRFDAASANAKQRTASEGLRNQQWGMGEDQDIRRRTQQANQSQNFMTLLAGLLG